MERVRVALAHLKASVEQVPDDVECAQTGMDHVWAGSTQAQAGMLPGAAGLDHARADMDQA
jgi:hypothetical protein